MRLTGKVSISSPKASINIDRVEGASPYQGFIVLHRNAADPARDASEID